MKSKYLYATSLAVVIIITVSLLIVSNSPAIFKQESTKVSNSSVSYSNNSNNYDYYFISQDNAQIKNNPTGISDNAVKAVVNKIVSNNNSIDFSNGKNNIIPVYKSEFGDVVTSSSSDMGYALQSTTSIDNNYCVSTIVPFKATSEGLINSFEYIKSNKKIEEALTDVYSSCYTSVLDMEYVDFYMCTTAYYAGYYNINIGMNFLRHSGITGYWHSSNSSASCYRLYAKLETAGTLYQYPEAVNCTNSQLESYKVQDYYFIRSTLSKYNATEWTTYYDDANYMPINRVVNCHDYWNHGMLVNQHPYYYINGTYRSGDYYTYYIYR